MSIPNSFMEAIKNGDVKSIRIMMKDSLLFDPTFAEFNEMSRLASGVAGLYDQHDGGNEFQHDKSAWNDDYMSMMMVQVVMNFSKERLDHLKAVVKHLRPVVSHSSSSSSRQTGEHSRRRTQQGQGMNYQEQKRHDQLNGSYRGVKIATGAGIGGAVGGTVAWAVGGSFVLGFVVGAVGAGTVAAIATSGE